MDIEKELSEGNAIVKDGVIRDINSITHAAEEHEACMMAMNKAGIPECNEDGVMLSIWGRALWMQYN